MTHVAYVNYLNEPVALDPNLHAKTKVAKEVESSHKGWRVIGIPEGAMEAARQQHEADLADNLRRAEKDKSVKPMKPWDEEAWRKSFKKRPVRSKPYETPDAAMVCKELAEKAGWTFVDVVEIKREVRAA